MERRKRTSKEFIFDENVGDYEIENIMLDMGYDVNILPKSNWEMMRKSRLTWLLIHLRLAIQHHIFTISRMMSVPVEIDGVKSIFIFEVVDIMDGTDPYPSLSGVGKVFDN